MVRSDKKELGAGRWALGVKEIAPNSQPLTPSGVPPVWIEVDLEAIRHNFRVIRQHVPPGVKILAVIKANAYGHGLLPVARALAEAGADALAVASVTEAVALRQAGMEVPILVLGQCLPEEAPLIVEHRLIPALGEIRSAQALSQAACVWQRSVFFHLKVDTGMGRYGVWHEEAANLYERIIALPGLKPQGIFTHLAMAGQDVQATEEQLFRFERLLHHLKERALPVGIRHAANSVGIIRFPASHWDLVRTGLLLYGVSPLKGAVPLDLRPALALKSRVRFLKAIQPGQTVSYGGTFRAERPTVVATLPVGYAHGYTRALSDKADLLIQGARARVIGRVTMEDLMADVTDIPGVEVGDEVVLLGSQGQEGAPLRETSADKNLEVVTAEELAGAARTIPYEILVGLSPNIPRFYNG